LEEQLDEPLSLELFVDDLAKALVHADSLLPIAKSSRSGRMYQAGIGPHSENETFRLVMDSAAKLWPARYRDQYEIAVAYQDGSRQLCDVCLGERPAWKWAMEAKLLRPLGDNGRPNDNMVMHLLSPYTAHRSALTDAIKLARSSVAKRSAVVVLAYETGAWPADPLLSAFETLARQHVQLGERVIAHFHGLVHPVHSDGLVAAWEVLAR
jgi:hypothetical protein